MRMYIIKYKHCKMVVYLCSLGIDLFCQTVQMAGIERVTNVYRFSVAAHL